MKSTVFLGLLLSFLIKSTEASAQSNSLPYLDQDFACFTNAQIQKYISDFKIDIASFGGPELCDDSKDSKKLFNDLSLIENGLFSETGSNLFIKNIAQGSYYPWMKSQTRGMERGNDVPYASAYNRGGYFTMQDGWASSSTLGRVGTVLHEARHTAGYVHIPCTQGPYQGSTVNGCDRDYSYGGSHALEMEYYARVSVQGQNFHPVYKTMARLMAIARSNFVFNRTPIQKKEGLLALDKINSSASLWVDGKIVQREKPQFQGDLKRTSFGASLWQGLKSVAIELYEISGFNPQLNDDYSYFKLLVRESGQLQDIEEFDIATKRFLVKIQNNQLYSFSFPDGDWGNPNNLPTNFTRSATTLPQGQKGYFIINTQGQVYQYNPSQNVFSLVPQITWSFNDRSWALMGTKKIALKTSGQIVEKTSDGTELPITEFSSQYSDLVNVPLYDGFDIKP